MKKWEDRDILLLLSGKWLFSLLGAMLFFRVHVQYSKPFLESEQFVVQIFENELALVTDPATMNLLQNWYLVITFCSLFLVFFVLHRTCFERLLTHDRKLDDVTPIIPPFPWDPEKFQLIVGLRHEQKSLRLVKNPEYLIIPEKGLFKNILIEGAIGEGKTSAVIYSILKQLLFYQASKATKKAGGLILDVKGNTYKQVLDFADQCGRSEDVYVIGLGKHKYNPLHRPDISHVELAFRCREVMELFSTGSKKDSFWDEMAMQMMAECIRLLRLVDGYVTMAKIYDLVNDESYLQEKLEQLHTKYMQAEDDMSEFDVIRVVRYFGKGGPFHAPADNTIANIKMCVNEMTYLFAAEEEIHDTFCPDEKDLSFDGFKECLENGKIVVFAMKNAAYPKAAKIIAAYLKLDFQSAVKLRVVEGATPMKDKAPIFFFADEAQEYVTSNDGAFCGLSRESKCLNTFCSQSHTSLLNALGKKEAVELLSQNLINKIWLRTDDEYTIKTAQFITGKEDKVKWGKSISENAGNTKKSKIFGRLSSDKTSISESLSASMRKEPIFDEKVFTQKLGMNQALCLLAGETHQQEPTIVHLMPYYEEPILTMSHKSGKPEPKQMKGGGASSTKDSFYINIS